MPDIMSSDSADRVPTLPDSARQCPTMPDRTDRADSQGSTTSAMKAIPSVMLAPPASTNRMMGALLASSVQALLIYRPSSNVSAAECTTCSSLNKASAAAQMPRSQHSSSHDAIGVSRRRQRRRISANRAGLRWTP
eukprot:1426715-Prymnesium_polylepis.2